MNQKKRHILFVALCLAVIAAAALYVFSGTRSMVPVTEDHEFQIPITYTYHNEIITEELPYYCCYTGNGEWTAYFSTTGMNHGIYVDEGESGAWLIALDLEGGYLMGDPQYADLYADGLPVPTITHLDYLTGNENSGLTELEEFNVRIVDWTCPAPIENAYVRSSPEITGTACVVLAVLALLLLLFAMILIRKDEDVVYGPLDRVSAILNIVLAAVGMPLITALCFDWQVFSDGSIEKSAVRLIPAITALGICASLVLRRSGNSRSGMAVQLVGPALFMVSVFFFAMVGFAPYSLTLPAGLLIGILIAVCSRKADDVTPNRLDKVSGITNIALIPVYTFASFPFILISALVRCVGEPTLTQEIITHAIAFIVSAAPIYCGIALGVSVSLRKKGKSTASFIVQFAGFAGLLLSLIGTVLADLLPWVTASLN